MIGLLVVVLYTRPELLTRPSHSLFFVSLFFRYGVFIHSWFIEGLGISRHLYDLDWHVMLCFHLFLISALLAHLFSFFFYLFVFSIEFGNSFLL